MHPILGSVRRLAIYLLAWILIGLLLSVGLGFSRGGYAARAVRGVLSTRPPPGPLADPRARSASSGAADTVLGWPHGL